jgi:hypothetical protein
MEFGRFKIDKWLILGLMIILCVYVLGNKLLMILASLVA